MFNSRDRRCSAYKYERMQPDARQQRAPVVWRDVYQTQGHTDQFRDGIRRNNQSRASCSRLAQTAHDITQLGHQQQSLYGQHALREFERDNSRSTSEHVRRCARGSSREVQDRDRKRAAIAAVAAVDVDVHFTAVDECGAGRRCRDRKRAAAAAIAAVDVNVAAVDVFAAAVDDDVDDDDDFDADADNLDDGDEEYVEKVSARRPTRLRSAGSKSDWKYVYMTRLHTTGASNWGMNEDISSDGGKPGHSHEGEISHEQGGVECAVAAPPDIPAMSVQQGGKCTHASGCERDATGLTKGLCRVHGGFAMCKHLGGCEKQAKSRGMCLKHGVGLKCKHSSGCDKFAQMKGKCWLHVLKHK